VPIELWRRLGAAEPPTLKEALSSDDASSMIWASRRAAGSRAVPFQSTDAMYVLDTNVVSELRRPKPHGAVQAWFDAAPAEALYISAVTLGKSSLASSASARSTQQRPQPFPMADRLAETMHILRQIGRVPRLGYPRHGARIITSKMP